MSEVTCILNSIDQGDDEAVDELLPLVYDELRRMAANKMFNEQAGHTLQATALVHEAYLRLVGNEDIQWNSRAHFFSAASEAMRRILIERARKKGRQKRGSHVNHVPLEELDIAIHTDDDHLLLVNEALEKLVTIDDTCAQLVKL